VNTEGALIRQTPDQMISPTQVYSTDLEIKVQWSALVGSTTGDSEILSYNLYWDNGTGTTDIELIDSLVTEFTVSGLIGGLNYKFKVRALNIYGYGEFNAEYLVEASDYPGKPPIATVSLSGTNVVIVWQAPQSHFAVIDSYEILFMTSDDLWVEDVVNCDGTDVIIVNALSCSLEMLDVEPLTGLAVDTLIQVKLRAHNS
jgi:hypothetical protein